MSYVNYVDHSRFGRVWYEVGMRNWCRMGYSPDQNRELGPLIVLKANGYLLGASDRTVEAAERKFSNLLDFYALDGDPLPTWTRRDQLRYFFCVCLPWRLRHPRKFLRARLAMRRECRANAVRIPR